MMVEKPKAKSEDRMAIDPRGSNPPGQNAPNKPTDDSRNLGGKVEHGKNEGGTKTEEDKKQEDARNRDKLIGRLGGAGSLSSVTQEEADKLAEGNDETEFQEDGRTVLVSSISPEETSKLKASGVSSAPVNFTQNLTGVPGNVDLTQGGRLSGDKSVRAQRTIEDLNEELEKTSGPNPQPNREGNEILKATQGVLSVGYVANTAAIADELKEMLKKDSLDAKDKERLSDIEKQLRINTRVA
jgi:hypothetical protein